jgi:4-oxalocrotonate tautomerase
LANYVNRRKKEFIYEVTEFTIKRLKIVPAKIQVLITELEKENFGESVAIASDAIFAGKSRVSNWRK